MVRKDVVIFIQIVRESGMLCSNSTRTYLSDELYQIYILKL